MSRKQIVVIGSGPGGSAIAWSLASAGVKVHVLEAGPRYNPGEDYRLHRNDWEVTHFPEKIPSRSRQTAAPLQKLESRWDHLRSRNIVHGRYVRAARRSFQGYYHVVGVGGSTLHYTGESHRMNPAAMSMRSRFGVAADWPVTYDELEPFYVQAENAIGVAGSDADPRRPRSADYPVPAHSLSYASRVLGKGFEKLGLNWVPNPNAILSKPYDGRPPCNYCGQCNRGCPRYDKGTPDITLIPKALATGNCTLETVRQVVRLEAGEGDRVAAAVYTDGQGALHRVEADLFVVACGAVETPRLLLNSAGPRAPEGLANESGLVGRNFMETIFWSATALHPDPVGAHRGLPSDAICWDFNAPDAIPGVIGGFRMSPGALEADFAGPIAYARKVVGGWGREHHRRMKELFGHAIGVGAIGESLPGDHSFVDLDPSARDRFGMPVARINSHLPEMEIRRLEFMAGKCREVLEACGAGERIDEYGSYDMFASTHVFGTCRMGTDPEDSVVDTHCRSHRWRNLMVTDASVFPSSGGGESPSLTIYAISLRAAALALESGMN